MSIALRLACAATSRIAAHGSLHGAGSAAGVAGEILRVDRFGNLITNIDRKTFDRVAREGPVVVRIATRDVDRLVSTYAEVPAGSVCALFGSTDHLEIAVNGGSAAETLDLARGAKVTVSRGGPPS